jgi:predicted ribosomally synthesized peptide with SipW-like signal peptide
MTKLKSKKMSKSTFAIIIMAIAMVAMLAFGGTYAYFTATAQEISRTNVKTAIVQISTTQSDTYAAEAKVVTGSYILGNEDAGEAIQVANGSNVATYVFVKATALVNDQEVVVGTNAGSALVLLTVDGWTAVDGHAGVYYKALGATDANASVAVTAQINPALKADRTQTGADAFTNTSNAFVKGGDNITDIMDKSVNVKIVFSAIQSEGFTDAAAAYGEYLNK